MKPTVIIAGAAVVALVAAGCSGDDVAENLVERAVEQETGENVDLDFDDGGFSVETDEGSVTFDEDGNFVITDESGEVVTGEVDVDADGDGFSVETDDGSMTLDEDGSFVIEGEDGEVITGDADDDGNVTIESDDGTVSFEQSDELPDDWPGDIPQPSGFAIESSSAINSGDGSSALTVSGTGDDAEGFVASYGAALESAGFTNDATFSQTDGIIANYTRNDGAQNVTIATSTMGDGTSQITVSVFLQ